MSTRKERPTRLYTTVAALIEQNGYFLLVEEQVNPDGTVLNQPAGHLEENEGIIEAVIRETREETARDFVPQSLVGIYHWQVPDNGPTYVRFCIQGTVGEAGPGQPLDSGILRTHWLSRDQLVAQSARLRSPMVMRCVDDYLAGRRYPLEILQNLLEEAATP